MMTVPGVTYDAATNLLKCGSCGSSWVFLGRGTPTRCPACPSDAHPLAGHAGDCARVTTATITGNNDGPCTCGGEG